MEKGDVLRGTRHDVLDQLNADAGSVAAPLLAADDVSRRHVDAHFPVACGLGVARDHLDQLCTC